MAVLAGDRVLAGPRRLPDPPAVVAFLEARRPAVVAVDAPRRPAPDGERSRPDERAFAAAGVCGIRFTPDRAVLDAPHRTDHYGWIRAGLALYAALDAAGLPAIECFPTATWTVLAGPRGAAPRGRWSAGALAGAGLHDVAAPLGQDERDALGAALTARLHAAGRTRSYGEIVVPASQATGSASRP